MSKIEELLSAPFDPSVKRVFTDESSKKELTYTPFNLKVQRMNEAFGVGRWGWVFEEVPGKRPGQVAVKGHVWSPLGATSIQYGGANINQFSSDADAFKSAVSDMVGKCLQQLGVAQEDYQSDIIDIVPVPVAASKADRAVEDAVAHSKTRDRKKDVLAGIGKPGQTEEAPERPEEKEALGLIPEQETPAEDTPTEPPYEEEEETEPDDHPFGEDEPEEEEEEAPAKTDPPTKLPSSEKIEAMDSLDDAIEYIGKWGVTPEIIKEKLGRDRLTKKAVREYAELWEAGELTNFKPEEEEKYTLPRKRPTVDALPLFEKVKRAGITVQNYSSVLRESTIPETDKTKDINEFMVWATEEAVDYLCEVAESLV